MRNNKIIIWLQFGNNLVKMIKILLKYDCTKIFKDRNPKTYKLF